MNKKGSDYIRMLREAEKVISFLEKLKEELNTEEKANFSRTIEIIVDYISKISEKK